MSTQKKWVQRTPVKKAMAGSSGGALRRLRARITKEGWAVDADWRPKPGFLYTQVRAISARVNQNFDGWPSHELKKSYKTFLGKPCFVNHANEDPSLARGVIVAARYVENGRDKYVDVIQEIDAERFPKLAHEIKTGGLDSVSMGAEAGFTICSYCKNRAVDESDFCDHVKHHKGQTLQKYNPKTGKVEDILVYESCHKLGFFELSYVFDPADETAVASKVIMAGRTPDEERALVNAPDRRLSFEQQVLRTAGMITANGDCLADGTCDASTQPMEGSGQMDKAVSTGINGDGYGADGGAGGMDPSSLGKTPGVSGGGTGADGIMDVSRPLYDDLKSMFPDSTIGGYRPGGDGYDEHNHGALDFMTTDDAQARQVMQKGFDYGAPYVLWQQRQWNPDGTSSAMETRAGGDKTQNHFDHVHIGPLAGPKSKKGAVVKVAGAVYVENPDNDFATEYLNMFYDENFDNADLATHPGVSEMVYAHKVLAAAGMDDDDGWAPVRAMIPGFIPQEGARPFDMTKPVFIHTNRHALNGIRQRGEDRQDIWSIKQPDDETGVHVRGYAPNVDLINARFNVERAGSQKFKDTAEAKGNGMGDRVVHAGVYGLLSGPPEEALPYSLMDYHPGHHTTFVHRDNGEPVHTADRVRFAFNPEAKAALMYGAQADNWGRENQPSVLFPPMESIMAANADSLGEPGDRPPVFVPRTARRRHAWGEIEAPTAIDTWRVEGSDPEDDTDDFYHYVDSPNELRAPDLAQAGQVDRAQAEQPMPGDPEAQQPIEPNYMTLKIPMPGTQPVVPPEPGMGGMPMQPPMPPQAPPQGMPMQPFASRITTAALDFFEGYYGTKLADWRDAIEANRDMTPEEAADYTRQAALTTLGNRAAVSTTSRNLQKGTADMAQGTLAQRGKTASQGQRRRHYAEGPLTDGGDVSRNDQGEQEEAFISETPGLVGVTVPDADDEISNTENTLVAKVRQGQAQLMRDAQALATLRAKRTAHRTAEFEYEPSGGLDEAGGPVATTVNPTVNTGPGAEALTGDDFESANPNDGVVETQPKDASLKIFQAFDSWLGKATGKTSRSHTAANIQKAASVFAKEAGVDPRLMFPALGIVLRQARKTEAAAKLAAQGKKSTKGEAMRKRADEKLEVAAPNARIDVEEPVADTTDAEAQASQFDIHDFGNNAGDDVADPDLSTDQNFAPGEAKKATKAPKRADGILAMRCAEAMIDAGLEENSRERKYQLAREFESMSRGTILDRIALAERFAMVRQADRRKVASGGTRGAARSPLPPGLTQAGAAPRPVQASRRVAANDPSNDSTLFV